MSKEKEEKSCYDCKHRGGVAGSCHSSCNRPDPNMTGDPHGIREGWFMYPYNFDPIWKTKECSTFERLEG